MVHSKNHDRGWPLEHRGHHQRGPPLVHVGNFEINLAIFDTGFAAAMQDVFANDLSNTEEVDLERWRQRSRSRQIIERLLGAVQPGSLTSVTASGPPARSATNCSSSRIGKPEFPRLRLLRTRGFSPTTT